MIVSTWIHCKENNCDQTKFSYVTKDSQLGARVEWVVAERGGAWRGRGRAIVQNKAGRKKEREETI